MVLKHEYSEGRKKAIKRVMMARRLRPSTQSGRDARGTSNAVAMLAATQAAQLRGWIGCGDLVDKALRRSPVFKRLPDEQRFAFAYVINTETGCWDWVASKKGPGSYGQFSFRQRNSNAHRVSWQIHVGRLADDLEIDHLCRNKACVNPGHLELVTSAENTRRWAVTLTTCPAGHARTYRQRGCIECRKDPDRRKAAKDIVARIAADRTARLKLSDDDVAQMKALRAEGQRVCDIAERFGVSRKYASAIITGWRTRRHRHTGPTKSALLIVFKRAGDHCEFVGCRSLPQHTHHRRPRRLGGTTDPIVNLPANLLRLCVQHHEWIESNRSEATKLGLLLAGSADPSVVPVVLDGGVFLLDNFGAKTQASPEVA